MFFFVFDSCKHSTNDNNDLVSDILQEINDIDTFNSKSRLEIVKYIILVNSLNNNESSKLKGYLDSLLKTFFLLFVNRIEINNDEYMTIKEILDSLYDITIDSDLTKLENLSSLFNKLESYDLIPNIVYQYIDNDNLKKSLSDVYMSMSNSFISAKDICEQKILARLILYISKYYFFIDKIKANYKNIFYSNLNIKDFKMFLDSKTYKPFCTLYNLPDDMSEENDVVFKAYDESINLINFIKKDILDKEKDKHDIYVNQINKLNHMDEKLDKLVSGQEINSKKLDDILFKVANLDYDIKSYKEFISYDLEKNNINEEMMEELLTRFQDKVVEKISSFMSQNKQLNINKEVYEDELKDILGISNFNKLDKDSINFIVTAKVMFYTLSHSGDGYDYSGVCLLLTKALENECKKRFYAGYKSYMKELYGDDIDKYPMWMINKYAKNKTGYDLLIQEHSFTLGTMAYATGYKLVKDDKTNNYRSMYEYCKEELFIDTDDNNVHHFLQFVGEGVADVARDYRNPAAHVEAMSNQQALDCYDYLLKVEALLKKILANCKY